MPVDATMPDCTERHTDGATPYSCHAWPAAPGAAWSIDRQRRASIRAGLEAAGELLAVLPRKARVDAVIDLRDKLDRGDVWASDYQALLGRVERSAA